jgi:hypothetical protein
VSGFDLEIQISDYLARIQISERFKAYCIKFLHILHAKQSETQRAIIEAQQKAYQDCLMEIDALVSLKTSPGNADGSQLSNEEYGQRRGKLIKEKAALEELLRDAGKRIEQQLRLTEQTFEFACTARERFTKGSPKTKKEILITLGSNLILKNKKLIIEAREPFFILEKSKTVDNPKNNPFEPDNNGLFQGRNDRSRTLRPCLLGGLDDVRTLQHRNEYLVKSTYAFFQSFNKSPYDIFPGWSDRDHNSN